MIKLYNLGEILGERYSGHINDVNINIEKNNYCLSKKDFYVSCDDRKLESYIEDIEDGDNFEDYCKYIFNLYKEEGYWE